MPAGNPNYPRRPAPKYGTFPAGDPRRKQIRTGAAGAPVAGLPIVVTVGVNAIGGTSVNVIGSVNPNGSATNWWISYGTSTPLPGTATSPQSIGSGTNPVTVTFSLTGLTTGSTYYVAVVGQSAAGTVYGETISFLAAAPTATTTTPVVPYGQPSVTIPHFQVPFQLTNAGAVVVDQDTLEEVFANVNVIVACPIGACDQLPTFGRPDPTFSQMPIDTSGLVAAIQKWEPRATEDVFSGFAGDGESAAITLRTSSTGAQGI